MKKLSPWLIWLNSISATLIIIYQIYQWITTGKIDDDTTDDTDSNTDDVTDVM
jgi:hypothetical protein